jgi:hypothetical protein
MINTNRAFPSSRRSFLIGVDGRVGNKIAPLGNIFLSLLPPDLDLLLLATFSEFILLESFSLIICD